MKAISVLLIVALLGTYRQLTFQPKEDGDIISVLSDMHRKDMADLEEALSFFVEEMEARDRFLAKASFINLRGAYKKVEPLLIYFEEETVLRKINGAPLPKVNPKAPGLEVLQPKGLQVLDEALCAEDYDEALKIAESLSKSLPTTLKFHKKRALQHRHIFEAMRLLVVRIYTWSMTGFDTPACADPMSETLISLQLLSDYFEVYAHSLSGEEKEIATEIVDHADRCIKTVVRSNFDNMKRLEIVRDYLNPIYARIYDLHKTMGIEYYEEVDPRGVRGYNYHAAGIFEEDYLNKGFLAEIHPSDLEDPKKIKLGKLLFYDPVMSRDLTMSCATCHQPSKAFTDGRALTPTRNGSTTLRNTPSLVNAVYANKYFWDLREYNLERQVKHVVYDSNEFDMDFVELADRLKESEDYMKFFKEAYGAQDRYTISTWSISNALAAYVASLSRMNSDFDRYARGESDDLSVDAIKGHDLFMGKANCGTCHFAPTFAGVVPPTYRDTESEVLGVLKVHDTLNPQLDLDMGRAANRIERDAVDFYVGSFKTMTVRNSELTAPYFHHGGYETLDEVIDFYDRGGALGMGIDLPHQTLPPDPLNLTDKEKEQLIAFMHALTDTTSLNPGPLDFPAFEGHPEWNDR